MGYVRYVCGYSLDTQRYELFCRGNAIKLRPKVFEQNFGTMGKQEVNALLMELAA
jgi:hypothetical protein